MQAFVDEFLLTEGFFDVLIDARLELRVMFQTLGLCLEHLLGLLLHGMGITQPVEQVFLWSSHVESSS